MSLAQERQPSPVAKRRFSHHLSPDQPQRSWRTPEVRNLWLVWLVWLGACMASLLAWASLRPGSASCRFRAQRPCTDQHHLHGRKAKNVDPHHHPARPTTCQHAMSPSHDFEKKKRKTVQACVQTVHAHTAIRQWPLVLRPFRFLLTSQGLTPSSILPLFFTFGSVGASPCNHIRGRRIHCVARFDHQRR